MPNIVSGSSDRLKKMREEESKIVKGKFSCHKPKGGEITFPYRKYKEDHIQNYTFKDGGVYEIPLGLARHLNSVGEEKNANLLDSEGNHYVGLGEKELRFTFQEMTFL